MAIPSAVLTVFCFIFHRLSALLASRSSDIRKMRTTFYAASLLRVPQYLVTENTARRIQDLCRPCYQDRYFLYRCVYSFRSCCFLFVCHVWIFCFLFLHTCPSSLPAIPAAKASVFMIPLLTPARAPVSALQAPYTASAPRYCRSSAQTSPRPRQASHTCAHA